MCGITGFADWKNRSSETILKAMNDTLNHRGPDSGDLKLVQLEKVQLGFAHKRLAIIDITETGKQPMAFQHLLITFNGEIYNFEEIKTELSALGHYFKGNSDTEMILHAYIQWGSACIEKFIGMFAFVIYDKEKNELFCARDRAGVKPFFYYFKDGLFLFSSELKSFHKHPDFQKEICLDAVADNYNKGIENSKITLPQVLENGKHSYHLYVIRTEKRDELQAYLKEKQIDTAIHYPKALPFLKCYEERGFEDNDFPIAAKIQHEILSIPMYPELLYRYKSIAFF